MLIKITIILFPFLIFVENAFGASKQGLIGVGDILSRVENQFSATELGKSRIESIQSEVASQVSLANPHIQFGQGFVENNTINRGSYDQLTISQTLQINGQKNALFRQGQLRQKIAEIESDQFKLQIRSQALFAAYQVLTSVEQMTHVTERLSSLKIVSKFLRTRMFSSAKAKVEAQLIENKIEEIQLEVHESREQLAFAKRRLQLFIGDFEVKQLNVPWISEQILSARMSKIQGFSHSMVDKRKAEIDVVDEEQKIAKNSWVPDLQVYYSESREKFSGGNQNQTLGVGIDVPIFNIGSNQRAKVNADRLMFEIEQKKQTMDLELSLRKIMQSFNLAKETLKIFNQRTISKKDKILNKTIANFKKGLVGAALFLDLEDQDHQIHKKVSQAKLDLHGKYLEAIVAAGHDIDFKKEFQ